MVKRLVLVALVLGVAAATGGPGTTGASAVPAGPTIPGTTCPAFPYDNVWNTRVNNLPVHPSSSTWLASMRASTTKLHPDYGPAGGAAQPYGIPWEVVDPSTPGVKLSFTWPSESNTAPYPLSASTPIEGGSDRHAIMVNPTTCRLYELFNTRYRPTGQSTAGSGAWFNLTVNTLRPNGWTSADAAGLAILPGLVDYDQVASAAMNARDPLHRVLHPEQVHLAGAPPGRPGESQLPADGRALPAQGRVHAAGVEVCVDVPDRHQDDEEVRDDPRGQRQQLVLHRDVRCARWTGYQVNQLKQIPASSFQAVDESCLRVNPNSGRAYQPGTIKYNRHCR